MVPVDRCLLKKLGPVRNKNKVQLAGADVFSCKVIVPVAVPHPTGLVPVRAKEGETLIVNTF